MPTLVRKDRFLWEIFPEIKVLSAEIRVRKYTYNRREILIWAKLTALGGAQRALGGFGLAEAVDAIHGQMVAS